MIIMKFGGSSLATATHIQKVTELIISADTAPCVVLSAMGNTTDKLLATARAAGAGQSEAQGTHDRRGR